MDIKHIKNRVRRLCMLVLFALILLGTTHSFAQTNQKITGKVTSESDPTGLPGVSVVVKGTTIGTVTNLDGAYSLEVPDQGVLSFSFVGFLTKEVEMEGQTTIDVVLEESTEALDEVVVTALGIRREEKSLGFSVGKVDGEELTRVAQENVLNSMAGKVAGVTVNSTGGAGSSVSMVIRGSTSLSSDNQPLFVVDGVPIASSVNNVGGFGEENRVDYGNAISDIDPESIENVTVLKGPSAAALYGTRAGNGVVLITTKQGSKKQGMKVSITSNTVFDIPFKFLDVVDNFASGYFSFRPEDFGGGILPEVSPFQAANSGPELDKGYWAVQWHSPVDANGVRIPIELRSYKDNFKNFVNDFAYTTTNGAAVSGSSEDMTYRLNVSNMTHKGLVPNSDLNKNSISFAASSIVRDNITISSNINFVNSFADNRPASNRGTNPLEWMYKHPFEIDIRDLKDYGSGANVLRVSNDHENPYFLANEVNNSFDRYRLYGNVKANWEITENLSLMGRMSLNKSDEIRETKIAPGYTGEPNNGSYGIVESKGLESNIDALLSYAKDWDDFTMSVSAGGNLLYSKASNIANYSKSGAGLTIPNLYTVQNIPPGALQYSNGRSQRAINSVYALANLAWREMVYLDLTARNDWSSTLPAENRSYFYPSASLSLMVDQMVNLGDRINMFKLRGGWAQVGKDTSPYQILPTYGNVGPWHDAIRLGVPGGLLNPNFLPEEATSIEFGADIRMFNNRLRFDGTYYETDNRNQIFGVPLAPSSGFTSVKINAGLLESKGWEFMVGGTPIKTTNWTWDLNLNFTKNETTIIELSEGIPFIEPWDAARVYNRVYAKNDDPNSEYGIRNGLVGNLYTRNIRRVEDESSPYYGYPIIGSGIDANYQYEEDFTKVGNYNPDFIMGLQSSLNYRNFTLSATFDWRYGGEYVSQSFRYLATRAASNAWLNELIHPEEMGGITGPELKEWVLANKDRLLLSEDVRPVGGPTPEYGGFPESFGPVTVYDGVFIPGVAGYYDDNGNFVLEKENFGDEGTTFLPSVASYAWELGRLNLYEADYIKLREVSLSYNLPNKISSQIGMENVSFSVYSRNIMLWAKDPGDGIDPERAYQAEGSGRFSQGVERFNADPWVIPVGFKVGFTF